MSTLRYGVVGTGAIGGYYGGRLALNGEDVHFLLHSDYGYVREHGLFIDSYQGKMHLEKVAAYPDTKVMPTCDVVLVGLKSVNNYLLPTLLPPLLHDNSVVVLIQNGMGMEEDLQKAMPSLRLAAGIAYIGASKTKPGRLLHQCNGSIDIADYSCKDNALLNVIVDDFAKAGVKAREAQYTAARWKKSVWNMPFNGMSVVMNATTSQLLTHPATRRLIHDLMLEVIGAARHTGGAQLDDSLATQMMEMTLAMGDYAPSMLLDHHSQRPMEIDYIYRRPIEEAVNAGFPMPRLEALAAELQFIDDRNRKYV